MNEIGLGLQYQCETPAQVGSQGRLCGLRGF